MGEGTRLGNRANYIYITDDGSQNVVLTLDETIGDLPGTGLARYTGTETNVCKNFKGFKPRGVYWQFQSVSGGRPRRKFIVCNLDGSYYKTVLTQAITIDGDAGFTTGRRGEQYTFLSPSPGGATGPST